MKRKKYVPKNPHEFKILRGCHIHDCGCDGIVTYRKGVAGTQHSCIPHIKKTNAQLNKTIKKADISALLDLGNLHTGQL